MGRRPDSSKKRSATEAGQVSISFKGSRVAEIDREAERLEREYGMTITRSFVVNAAVKMWFAWKSLTKRKDRGVFGASDAELRTLRRGGLPFEPESLGVLEIALKPSSKTSTANIGTPAPLRPGRALGKGRTVRKK